jgi:phenylalanine-4-hydroxylase
LNKPNISEKQQVTMSFTQQDYQRFADENGIDLSSVGVMPEDQFITLLVETVQREDVPYPIPAAKRQPYIDAFKSGKLFAIGEFSDESVDLKHFANEQDYDRYTFEEHLSWACLVAQQQKSKRKFACREYLHGEELFEIGAAMIPNYYLLNARIFQQTNWQLATVKEIIPAELFFTCHARRFFPVTTFMRPLGVDYLEEPDIGHDVAGHVATFTIPAVANVMQNHGQARNLIYAKRDDELQGVTDPAEIAKIEARAEKLLTLAGRIYWFTVEFGLVMQDGQMRAFGAGILSSPGETRYSIEDPESNRILIDPSDDADLLRLANTDYLISEFQKTYFVSESFDRLDSLTPERILAASEKALSLPDFTWREIIPGDRVLNVGTTATSVNEKYYRLMAGQTMDECLKRTAIANLELINSGFDDVLMNQFRVQPPAIPDAAIDWFRESGPRQN